MLGVSLLAATLVATAPEVPAPPADDAAVQPDAIAVLVVDAVSIDAALVEELALRLRWRELVATDVLLDVPASRFAWVGVEWLAGDRARLRLVISDGRAYSRLVEAPAQQLHRAVAGVLANMLDAIEHGEIEPEEVGVAVPLPAPKPTPTPTPPTEPAAAPARPSEVARAIEATQRWELGPFIAGVAVLGVGPPTDLDGFVGAGAALGLDARPRSGGLAAMALRVLTHANDELRIVRVRVALAGGYVLRRRAFELTARAGASVEPVILRDGGSVPDLRKPSGGAVASAPLVGVLAGLAPAYVLRAQRRPLALRLALELELAASMEARSPPGAIRYVDAIPATPVPLVRAGGVELALGLAIGGWFGVARH